MQALRRCMQVHVLLLAAATPVAASLSVGRWSVVCILPARD